MDLNHLYARHQMSMLRADAAAHPHARAAHAAMAADYALRIDRLRSRLGAPFQAPAA